MEQITNEMKSLQGSQLRIAEFLNKKLDEDTVLAEKYTNGGLTIKALWTEVMNYARKKAINGSCCLEDNEVFGVVLHCIDESKPMPEVKKKEYKEIKVEESSPKPKPKKKDDWTGLSEALF